MDGRIVISVRDLTKAYQVWSSAGARLTAPLLLRLARLPLIPAAVAARWQREIADQAFQALRGITFEVQKNETFGIVGRNGSGKSTLLQLIAGILTPSSGSVAVSGRVAAILELGAGFNPEFTGRENARLNATILGLTEGKIEERLDAIANFAGIGSFFDQPVKTYSSGMYVRLGFAVATNVDADILIVDEALAVGDEAFQRKCFSWLRSFKDKGGTILFVSHSAAAVVELCDRAMLLDQGELLLTGTPQVVVSWYHKLIYAPPDRTHAIRDQIRETTTAEGGAGALAELTTAPGLASASGLDTEPSFDPHLVPQSTVHYEARGAVITSPRIVALSERSVNVLRPGHDYLYEYRVHFLTDCFNVRFGMLVKTVRGFEVGGAVSALPGSAIDHVNAGTEARIRFRFRCLLAPGAYFLNAGVLGTVDAAEVFLHRVIDAVMFRVEPEPHSLVTGVTDLCVIPEVALIDAALPKPV